MKRSCKHIRQHRWMLAFFLAGAAASGNATAQTCGGFGDVTTADFYCNNVEWLKNRGVTTGCGGGLYCPAAPVIRGAMAAFMNRLGVALTPQPVLVQASTGALNLDAAPVICASTDITATPYPRAMLGTWHLDGLTGGTLAAFGRVVKSNDSGATWNELPGTVTMRTQTDAAQWTNVSGAGGYDIAAGEAVRFALRLGREVGGGSAQFTGSTCQINLQVINRNAASPPF